MTYDELVTAVSNTVENSFSKEDMDRFIRQTEQRIYHTVQLANLRKNVTGSISSGNKYLSAPSDFLSTYSIAVVGTDGRYNYLLPKDPNFIREAYPSPTSTGTPRFYALFGPQSGDANELVFLLGPTPNADYTTELHYFYVPESIVDVGSTWLGENFDSALLCGALCEAITFMKGEQDMVALYKERYVQAIALLKNLGDAKQRGDTYRNGQLKIDVS